MTNGPGFYKAVGDGLNVFYAPNAVYGPVVILLAALQATYIFPVNGWTRSATENAARIAFGATAEATLLNVKKFGATGDKTTDDTAAINAAITFASNIGGGTVLVPPGTYMIEAVNTHIQMKSNVDLVLSHSAILQAITNSAANYSVILAAGVSNAGIYGGSIRGDRTVHTGATGEWGFGIDLENATNFDIVGTYISNCWGDGIYVSDNANSATPSTNVSISRVTSDNNRRQGLSAINWIGGTITGSTFKNTNGTSPQAGIDFEPNLDTQQVSGLSIHGNSIINNAGDGFDMTGASQRVFGNTFSGNIVSGSHRAIVLVDSSYNTFSDNQIRSNNLGAIWFTGASSYNIINNNQLSQNNQAKLYVANIMVRDTSNTNVFLKNTITSVQDWAGVDIPDSTCLKNTFLDTTFSGTWGNQAFVDGGTETVRNDSF